MYSRILVPVDGSSTANCGLDEAVELARLTGASIRLIHVVDQLVSAGGMDVFGAMTGDVMRMLREGGEQILKTCKTRVEASDVAADTILLDIFGGGVCELVVAEAQRWHADLTVIGTHGRRGVGRMFLGSDAEQIARLVPTPVLLIRSRDAVASATALPALQIP